MPPLAALMADDPTEPALPQTPTKPHHHRPRAGLAALLLAAVSLAALAPATHNPPAAKQPAAPATTPASLDARFQRDVLPILEQHCYSCHGMTLQRGGVDLEAFASYGDARDHLAHLVMLGDVVRNHDMPPAGRDAPTDAQRAALVTWVNDALRVDDPDRPLDPGAVTLRRLNRNEYANTLRDLLLIDEADARRIVADFPADETGYGFDNVGDTLTLSPLHLERYLDAAERAIALAVVEAAGTEPATRTLTGAMLDIDDDGAAREGNRQSMMLYSRATVAFTHHVPIAGTYELRLRLAGDQAGDELPRADLLIGTEHVESFDVSARRDRPQTHTHRVRLEPGDHRIGIAFNNDYYREDAPRSDRDRNLIVHGIDIEGPFDTDPNALPASHRRLFTTTPRENARRPERAVAADLLRDFTRRAYRSPASNADVARYVRLFEQAREDGDSFEAAVGYACSAVLVSPRFLFLLEDHPAPHDPAVVDTLSDHELASRLSYFLWSSMPDDTLLALADAGTLSDPDTLDAQITRMLADPKAAALVEHFPGQWLQLRNLALVEPNPDVFPDFDDELRDAMQREVQRQFHDILTNQRPITDLIDADHTFINARLAELYGLDAPHAPINPGAPLVRVDLPADSPRGGVLTAAAVLTLTSNPDRTSPVKRGLFILENILGSPPPPPPADVPAIAETQQAAEDASLRERLELHLVRPDCRSCHQRMDPIGYSLEHFDPLGRWRDQDTNHAIDDQGTLPDGRAFEGPDGLKAIVLQERDAFVRTLTEKLMTYALGRGIEPSDMPVVLRIADDLQAHDATLDALIRAIIDSPPFRQHRGRAPGEPAD